MDKWISVKDKLPESKYDMVVAYTKGNDVFLVWYNNNFDELNYGWTNENDIPIFGVTHWLPLPQPPKEG